MHLKSKCKASHVERKQIYDCRRGVCMSAVRLITVVSLVIISVRGTVTA